MKYNRIILILAMITLSVKSVQAQEMISKSSSPFGAVFYFRFDRAVLDSGYMHNAVSLMELERIFSDTSTISQIDSIKITTTSSIDGNIDHNYALALLRATAIKVYILWKYPHINKEIITTRVVAENWEGLKRCVEQDDQTPFQGRVLEIIDQDVNLETKEWRLRQVGDGTAWKYITNHFLKHLRSGSTQVDICQQESPPPVHEQIIKSDSIAISPINESKIAETNMPRPDADSVTQTETYLPPTLMKSQSRRPIALKTNLLLDAATVLNIEVEIPIGKHWSIAGEWMFPWWLWEKKQNCLQVLSGNLEVRYWIKSNYKKQEVSLEKHNPLSGWFVGLYGGAGLYDLELERKGYQGEFFIAMGVSGGYVLPLSRNLSMEFSLGIGYLQTDYRQYDAKLSNIDNQWHLIRQQNGSYTWFGPTKAKISLIWYPHLRSKKGGVK